MSSDLIMQNTIIDCYNTQKNEIFIMTDSLFNERIDYLIELLFMFRSRLSRVDNKIPPSYNGEVRHGIVSLGASSWARINRSKYVYQ